MRIVVMSDIHGNLAALEAFERLGISRDGLYCLGDVVGYGPFPEECVRWIVGQKAVVIQGNHERALFDAHERRLMTPLAGQHILWTRRHVSPEMLGVMRTWPVDTKQRGFWLCHGSPDDPDRYIVGPKEVALALYALEEAGLSVALFGHTHYPGLVDDAGNFWYEIGVPYDLKKSRRYLINPGSLGQPRDGDPRASFCLLSSHRGGWRVEFFRYEYDIQATVEAMLSRGIDPALAYRLMVGR